LPPQSYCYVHMVSSFENDKTLRLVSFEVEK
jgi:hypothetical protein